jgi:hypothetical protein
LKTLFPEDGVVVSHLLQVPQLSAILVGFNFGSWQIWNTASLSLEFASAYEGSEPTDGPLTTLPVTGFAFCEPENDPRNFCYVWVCRSDADFDTAEEKMASLKSHARSRFHESPFPPKSFRTKFDSPSWD